jgi:hypothetical protein
MDRVLMRVMILKEDVEYSRFKTKPFQLLMVTDDAETGKGEEEEAQQQQQTHQQQQQLQQQTAAAAAAAAAMLRQSSATAALSSGGSVGSPRAQAGATPVGLDISSSGSRSAAAAAAAAAARVSAAASALAAHMTNPQQLWNEKRGSGSGLRSRRHSK